MPMLADGVLWYVVFLFSTTCHEAAHAFAAMKLGDLTAYQGGQVTLDPIPHIRREPFGTVVVPIISFLVGGWMIGWASAPYDPAWALRYPKRSAVMALAGPTANLILLLLASAGIQLGLSLGTFYPPESITFGHVATAIADGMPSHFASILSVMFTLNLILLVFNLLPLPPLDGSGALPLFMSDRLAEKYMAFTRRGAFALIGILVAWRVFGDVFRPIHLIAINLLYPGLGYE